MKMRFELVICVDMIGKKKQIRITLGIGITFLGDNCLPLLGLLVVNIMVCACRSAKRRFSLYHNQKKLLFLKQINYQ